MLLHIPNVLSATQLVHVRERLQTAEWTDGRETVGITGAQVKRNLQVQDLDPIKTDLGTLIIEALHANPLFFAAALPLKIMPPRFNCYQDGGTYGEHVDGAVMRLDGQSQLRSDISATLFLNEPAAYEGGELIINDTFGVHEIKLAAGDLILYSSGAVHEVSPVTKGQRLASFFWVQSMVRDANQRDLLLELDQSIQALQASNADVGSVVRLTGIYHNLLRQWSEV